jgi:hypothetical protein
MRTAIFTLFSALSLALPAAAQSLAGPSSNGNYVQFNGPKAGACNFPSGPLLAQWGYAAPYFCPVPDVLAPAPAVLGDIAANRFMDTLWMTDGSEFAEYAAYGTVLSGFEILPGDVLPGPVTGLGYDPGADLLWITDGTQAAAMQPPPQPGCPQLPNVVWPAFALPIGAGATATDIDWDAKSGSL